MNINKKAIAEFFYEQCAGSYSGHMAVIPNNPTISGLFRSFSESKRSVYSIERKEFAEALV